jgi:hypothetical protein
LRVQAQNRKRGKSQGEGVSKNVKENERGWKFVCSSLLLHLDISNSISRFPFRG